MLIWRGAWLWEQGQWDAAEHASILALHSAKQTGLAVTNAAFDICGARAAYHSHPIGRAYRGAFNNTEAPTLGGHVVAEAVRRGDHINVDLVTGRLGPRGHRTVSVWSMLAVIAVGVVLLIDGINAVIGVYTMGLVSEGYLEIKMWIPQSAIILGSVMLIVTGLVGMIRALAGYPADDRLQK